MRNALDINVENPYLYIHVNMCTSEEFDPRPAIIQWLNSVKRSRKYNPKAKALTCYKGNFKENAEEETDADELSKNGNTAIKAFY